MTVFCLACGFESAQSLPLMTFLPGGRGWPSPLEPSHSDRTGKLSKLNLNIPASNSFKLTMLLFYQVNNAHWRPITSNCDPCRQRCWTFPVDKQKGLFCVLQSLEWKTSCKSLWCRFSLVMHLDTLARDSTFLKQKLSLNIDTGFVRQ